MVHLWRHLTKIAVPIAAAAALGLSGCGNSGTTAASSQNTLPEQQNVGIVVPQSQVKAVQTCQEKANLAAVVWQAAEGTREEFFTISPTSGVFAPAQSSSPQTMVGNDMTTGPLAWVKATAAGKFVVFRHYTTSGQPSVLGALGWQSALPDLTFCQVYQQNGMVNPVVRNFATWTGQGIIKITDPANLAYVVLWGYNPKGSTPGIHTPLTVGDDGKVDFA